MKIIINGDEHTINNNMSVDSLVTKLELDQDRIAIERNLEIVPACEYKTTMLAEKDKIEIVEFIGGG